MTGVGVGAQDLTGELVLSWSKWGPETLVTTDNGMTWVCDEYVRSHARPPSRSVAWSLA